MYYVSFIFYDFKMLGGKYENCVFSVVPVIYMPYTPFFLNLPNPEPTVYCLTGRSGADHCKYSSNKSSWAFRVKEMPGLFLALQFLPAEAMGRKESEPLPSWSVQYQHQFKSLHLGKFRVPAQLPSSEMC